MTTRMAIWACLMALLITVDAARTHDAGLRSLQVGQTRPQVLAAAGPPARVEPAVAGRDECLAWGWSLPPAERWVFLRGGRVVKVYDAPCP